MPKNSLEGGMTIKIEVSLDRSESEERLPLQVEQAGNADISHHVSPRNSFLDGSLISAYEQQLTTRGPFYGRSLDYEQDEFMKISQLGKKPVVRI